MLHTFFSGEWGGGLVAVGTPDHSASYRLQLSN